MKLEIGKEYKIKNESGKIHKAIYIGRSITQDDQYQYMFEDQNGYVFYLDNNFKTSFGSELLKGE